MTDQGDLIGLAEAAERVGVCRETLARRLARAGATLYVDPADNRRRLVRLADFEAVGMIARPVDRPRKEAAAA